MGFNQGKSIALKPSDDHNSTMARVLVTEGEALIRFADNPPEDFSSVVEMILHNNGRLIVSGIGKSGHVGRKIAATLASTGTPSFFVHPAEASHGDLGMVMPGDICLLISNSGETAELGDIIAHCKRFSIPIVGISKCMGSTLMNASTYRLPLPDSPEACSIGMAPTTSTTLTIALGDALAVALMEARSFKADNFRTYHPGGKLGAKLATVFQLMHSGESVPVVNQDTNMSDAIISMTSHGFGVTAVIDNNGCLSGVISDGDLRRHMDGLLDRKAGDVATRNPIVVTPETLAAEALAVMNDKKITALFVVDPDHIPVGILHLHACLRAGVA